MSRILIIEDDDAIAAIERDYLAANGYQVDVATDGTAGLQAALNGAHDLILLDVMLPGIDGLEICRRIRAHVKVPILMVTAKKEVADTIRGLGLGADDYIVKPFSPSELVARVRSHLSMYARLTEHPDDPADTPEITVGAIRINPTTRRVHVRGQEVELKNKEFQLLAFLATNPDVVFSKEQLYEHVWGMAAYGGAGTVAVHINRLRDKIEQDPAAPAYIQTVWGVGYRFVV